MLQTAKFFSYLSYKSLLVDLIATYPRRGYGQANALARSLKVHSSLISQVLNGPKNISLEQALGIARYFSFTSRQTDYFLLLVQRSKAGSPDLKMHFEQQVQKFRADQMQVTGRIADAESIDEAKLASYDSDSTNMATWLCTTLNGKHSVQSIARRLDITLAETERILEFLLEAGLCQQGRLPSTHPKDASSGHVAAGAMASYQLETAGRRKGWFSDSK